MISIALDKGLGVRGMFCGYKYAPDDPNTHKPAETHGPIQWVVLTEKRGVWVGDMRYYHPVAFSTIEMAREVRDEIAATHEPLADRLLLVNATTGTEIERADA